MTLFTERYVEGKRGREVDHRHLCEGKSLRTVLRRIVVVVVDIG